VTASIPRTKVLPRKTAHSTVSNRSCTPAAYITHYSLYT